MEHTAPILNVGVRFNTMEKLRIACKRVALLDNFEFSTKKSDKKRYTIQCSTAPTCPWRLHASLISSDGGNSEIVEIRTFVNEHTCNGVQHANHKQASSSLITTVIQARLQDQPGYRPKDKVFDDISGAVIRLVDQLGLDNIVNKRGRRMFITKVWHCETGMLIRESRNLDLLC